MVWGKDINEMGKYKSVNFKIMNLIKIKFEIFLTNIEYKYHQNVFNLYKVDIVSFEYLVPTCVRSSVDTVVKNAI